MGKRLLNDSAYWDSFYAQYKFPSLKELGFTGFKRVEVEVVEPPVVLKDLQSLINDFWGEFVADNPGAKRNPKFGVTGVESVEVAERALKVRAFEMDYATIVFGSDRRGEKYDSQLTAEQRHFLQTQLATLGIIGITKDQNGRYLIGTKAGTRVTGGLKEPLPMGMVDPNKTPTGFDPFMSGLLNELNEETGLYLRHLDRIEPTHFSIGMGYEDFALIFDLKLRPGAEELVKISSEHSEAAFMDRQRVGQLNKYEMNPVLVGSLSAKGIYID